MTKSSQNERRYSAQFTLGYSHGLLIGIASFILWELTLSINSVGLVGNLFQSLFSREHVGTVTTTNQSDFEWANVGQTSSKIHHFRQTYHHLPSLYLTEFELSRL